MSHYLHYLYSTVCTMLVVTLPLVLINLINVREVGRTLNKVNKGSQSLYHNSPRQYIESLFCSRSTQQLFVSRIYHALKNKCSKLNCICDLQNSRKNQKEQLIKVLMLVIKKTIKLANKQQQMEEQKENLSAYKVMILILNLLVISVQYNWFLCSSTGEDWVI